MCSSQKETQEYLSLVNIDLTCFSEGYKGDIMNYKKDIFSKRIEMQEPKDTLDVICLAYLIAYANINKRSHNFRGLKPR